MGQYDDWGYEMIKITFKSHTGKDVDIWSGTVGQSREWYVDTQMERDYPEPLVVTKVNKKTGVIMLSAVPKKRIKNK